MEECVTLLRLPDGGILQLKPFAVMRDLVEGLKSAGINFLRELSFAQIGHYSAVRFVVLGPVEELELWAEEHREIEKLQLSVQAIIHHHHPNQDLL